jgi:hypothetical protein
MKYKTLKKIDKLQNEVGDIVDIYDEIGGEEVEKAVKEGVLELCDQELKNKHFMALMKPQDIKLTVNKTN